MDLALESLVISMISNNDIFEIKDPNTIEEYQRASSCQRLMWHLKWTREEYNNETKDIKSFDKIKYYNKVLEKNTYQIHNIESNTYSVEYEDIESMLTNNNIDKFEFRYIKRYTGKKLKKPKYYSLEKIVFIKNKYILKDNDYIKECSNILK
jgi:hypothetical protein